MPKVHLEEIAIACWPHDLRIEFTSSVAFLGEQIISLLPSGYGEGVKKINAGFTADDYDGTPELDLGTIVSVRTAKLSDAYDANGRLDLEVVLHKAIDVCSSIAVRRNWSPHVFSEIRDEIGRAGFGVWIPVGKVAFRRRGLVSAQYWVHLSSDVARVTLRIWRRQLSDYQVVDIGETRPVWVFYRELIGEPHFDDSDALVIKGPGLRRRVPISTP